MTEQDWTTVDANNLLALGLNRYVYAEKGDGFIESLKAQMGHTYSNGTEHGFAQERADYVLQAAPMLRRVLEAGVHALTSKDDQYDRYIVALTIGDSEKVIAIEDELREQVPA